MATNSSQNQEFVKTGHYGHHLWERKGNTDKENEYLSSQNSKLSSQNKLFKNKVALEKRFKFFLYCLAPSIVFFILGYIWIGLFGQIDLTYSTDSFRLIVAFVLPLGFWIYYLDKKGKI